MNKFVFSSLFAIYFILACSTETKTNSESIVIKDIILESSTNRMPRANDFQMDIELRGIVSDANLKQDIQYKWLIDYVKLDVKNDDQSSDVLPENTKTNYYFIDVSKNPLNSILSVYKEGFYKISLSASNVNESKIYSIMVKVGNPVLPNLYLKFNVPKIKKVNKNDFKGQLYLGYYNNLKNKSKMDIIEIKASDVLDGWYKTNIVINPFDSFYLEAGTHVIDAKPVYISSLNKKNIPKEVDSIVYDFQGSKEKSVNISPLILKDINANTILTIYKNGVEKWDRGEILLSFLSWGYDDNGNNEFSYFENKINNTNKTISNYLNKKYLVKIFVGSIGARLFNNDYFIYFGPEGTESDEFDTQKSRDIPGLPYGYLIGKLGEEGSKFPIGNSYNYIYSNDLKIYAQNRQKDFTTDVTSDND